MALKIKKGISLSKYSTFHTGGKAQFFVEVKNAEELAEAVNFADKQGISIFVLGGGSNVLFSDKGFDGLLIKMDIGGMNFGVDGEDTIVYAGAGEKWDDVVAKSVERGLGGIENLSLIPGTIGGAVYQNIGAYGVELKDVLYRAVAFNKKTGKIVRMFNGDCGFGYRRSFFQSRRGGDFIIIGAELKLSGKPVLKLDYPDLIKYFGQKKPTVGEVRKAVINIRKSKLQYPTASIGTAGSFFKNPIITTGLFNKIISVHTGIRGRSVGNGVKLSAGQLIERAGWKGKRLSNAGVSKKHALVLVSYRQCRTKDVLLLADSIKEAVKAKFGVDLEPEVKIVA